VRAGTSKGSTISQYGCSTFGALAAEALKLEKTPIDIHEKNTSSKSLNTDL
jgi:hypothetical protein